MFPLAASDPEQPPSPSPSPPLSSLPNDILLDILARVPKRYYPMLSCVCKEFQTLVRSHEIRRTRFLHGKDSLYICFQHNRGWRRSHLRRNWFTLRRNEKNPTTTENLFSPAADNFSSMSPDSIVAVGPEIFLIFGSDIWVYDSRSGKYSRGPDMKAKLVDQIVGVVGDKIYVIGVDSYNENQAEFFDVKTRTWKTAPVHEGKSFWCSRRRRTFALDRSVFALGSPPRTTTCSYDTRDGSCRSGFKLAKKWQRAGVCVMENVLYAYYSSLGLMWYDSKLTRWRLVDGLDGLDKIRTVGLAEYYGKLAFMWVKWDGVSVTKEVWCRMIALEKSEVGMHGNAEPPQLLGIVPRYYILRKCMSLVD